MLPATGEESSNAACHDIGIVMVGNSLVIKVTIEHEENVRYYCFRNKVDTAHSGELP